MRSAMRQRHRQRTDCISIAVVLSIYRSIENNSMFPIASRICKRYMLTLSSIEGSFCFVHHLYEVRIGD